MQANARVGKDYAVAWVYHRGNIYEPQSRASGLEAATGKLLLTGMQAGKYRYTWWDTYEGRSISADDIAIKDAKEGVEVPTPPIKYDAALYVTKAGIAPVRLKTVKIK